MKYYLLTAIFIFISLVKINAQAELVPNNGFETIATCPVGFSQFEDFVATWVDPNTASPDYMNVCANPFPAGVPKNGTGYQAPHGGDAYAGIYTFSGTLYREFIQIQLLSTLTAGSTYSFSMYVVLHNKSNTAIDDLGVYFSDTAPTAAGTGMLAGAPLPQISNPFGSVIMDTLNWTLISGTYTATGGEQFLTLGHLKSDAATTYQPVPFGTQGAYYYIDDVSLKEVAVLPVLLTSFNAELITEQSTNPFTQITWSTSTEINNCCFYIERSFDGNSFTDIGIVPGNGNSTSDRVYLFYDHTPCPGFNYYRLRQENFDGVSTITNTISVNNIEGKHPVTVSQNDHLIYLLNSANHNLYARLYGLSAESESTFTVDEGNSSWVLPDKLHGIYLMLITDPQSGINLLAEKIFLN